MNSKIDDELTSSIHFHISGEGFDPESGYNLKCLLASLNSVQGIIEKTYTFVSEKERFTTADESNLQIKITNIQPGSFQADLQILMGSIILPVTELLQLNNPKQLWNLATECYKYIQNLLKARKEGHTLKMETDNSNGTVNVVNEGSGEVNIYNIAVPELSKKLSHNFNQLNNLVSEQGFVSDISISDSEDKSNTIQVNKRTSGYFVKQEFLDDTVQTVNGIIYKIDAKKFTGNITVNNGNGQVIPNDYKFSFIDKDGFTLDDLKDCIMKDTQFKCLTKRRLDPSTLTENVIELKIIKIEKSA